MCVTSVPVSIVGVGVCGRGGGNDSGEEEDYHSTSPPAGGYYSKTGKGALTVTVTCYDGVEMGRRRDRERTCPLSWQLT